MNRGCCGSPAFSGLGGTLFDPPRAALVVKLVRPHQRGRFFSILMMQDSAGAVIGACSAAGCCNMTSVLSWRGRGVVCRLRRVQRLVSPGVKLSTVKTPVREGLGRVLRAISALSPTF